MKHLYGTKLVIQHMKPIPTSIQSKQRKKKKKKIGFPVLVFLRIPLSLCFAVRGEVDVISEDVEMLKLRMAAYHSPTASSPSPSSTSKAHPLNLIDSVRDRLLELHSDSQVATRTRGTPASLSPRSAESADAVSSSFSRSESLREEGKLGMDLAPLQMGVEGDGGGGMGMGLFGKKVVEEGEEDWVNVEGSRGKSSSATPGSSQSSIRSN